MKLEGQLNDKAEKPVFGLGEHWKSCVALNSRKKHHEQLTPKQCGQLKKLADQIGPMTKGLITFAVDNWHNFGHEAVNSAGLLNYPPKPHIGFLLAHYHSAISLMHTAHAKTPSPNPSVIAVAPDITGAPEKLQSIAQNPEVPVSSPPEKVQADEKAAQLAKQNQADIEKMMAKFAAAGEPPPPITYNDFGEVVYKLTKKELSELFESLKK
jgi:hypothetical protein